MAHDYSLKIIFKFAISLSRRVFQYLKCLPARNYLNRLTRNESMDPWVGEVRVDERSDFFSLILINIGINEKTPLYCIVVSRHDPRAWHFTWYLLWLFYLKDVSGSSSRTLPTNVFLHRKERHDQKFIFLQNSGFSSSRFLYLSPTLPAFKIYLKWRLRDLWTPYEAKVTGHRLRVDRKLEGPSSPLHQPRLLLFPLLTSRLSSLGGHIVVFPELRPETFMSRSSCFRDRITDRTLPAVPRLFAISVRAIGARSIFQLIHFLSVAILIILIQIFVKHFISVCATSCRIWKLLD